jgi:hypothetical protein
MINLVWRTMTVRLTLAVRSRSVVVRHKARHERLSIFATNSVCAWYFVVYDYTSLSYIEFLTMVVLLMSVL